MSIQRHRTPSGTKRARQLNSRAPIQGQGLTKEQQEWNKQVEERKQQKGKQP